MGEVAFWVIVTFMNVASAGLSAWMYGATEKKRFLVTTILAGALAMWSLYFLNKS